MKRKLKFIHPGTLLLEETEFRDWSIEQCSSIFDVSKEELALMFAGKSPITEHLANKLAQYTGCSPNFWLNMQKAYDKEN